MKYYSQYGQDKFIDEIVFPNKKDGVFVEIGAEDGINFSNSYFFEKNRNWTGLCIEPRAEAFDALNKNRSCVCEKLCISNHAGKERFLNIRGDGAMLSGLLSNYDPRHMERVQKTLADGGDNNNSDIIEIECKPLSAVLNKHDITKIDYLSIDTEGNELDILQSIDFIKTKISAITVENQYRLESIKNILGKNNFVRVAEFKCDELYLNKNIFDQKQLSDISTNYLSSLKPRKTSAKQYTKQILLGFGINVSYLKLPKDFKVQKKLTPNSTNLIIFDVGASRGQTYAKYRTLFPKAKIYCFEPYLPAYEHLKSFVSSDNLAVVQNIAVGDKNGESILYCNNLDYTNSLSKTLSSNDIHDPRYLNKGEQKIATKTIDTIIDERNLPGIDILKMDIQGGELNALKGASKTLKTGKIGLIYTEVAYVKTYENQPLYDDIENFLANFGYKIFGIYNKSYDKNGTLMQADAIFIKND